MNDFPRWKYALIAVMLVLGFVYALPNVFPSVPAVQISASHEAKVDEALKEKVIGVLQTKKIEFRDVQLQGERLLARFANPDLQLSAQDALKADLGEEYIVAPNLASTVPGWLLAIGANVVDVALGHLVERGFLVDFHQEVHAALQVEAKRHRVGADRAQPAGHGRREVRRDDVCVAQFGLERVLRGQLRVRVGELRGQALALKLDVAELDLLGLQDAEHLFLQRFVDLGVVAGGNLHGRHRREHVRQRIDKAEHQHDRDQRILPAGKFVHSLLIVRG